MADELGLGCVEAGLEAFVIVVTGVGGGGLLGGVGGGVLAVRGIELLVAATDCSTVDEDDVADTSQQMFSCFRDSAPRDNDSCPLA